MSILEIMKQKKKERLTEKHPFYDEDISFRFSYCVGNALLASVDNGINDIEKTALNDLGLAIGLSEDEIENVIANINEVDSTVIDTIIDTFTEESHRFLFLLDLYRMAYQDGNLVTEEKEMIGIFADLLNFSDEKEILIEKFAQSVKEENHAKAQELVNSIQKQGIDIPMNVLRYFAPNLNIDVKSKEQEENFEEYSETIVNKQGNTLWNLRNDGLIAHQGEWIYYANHEDNNKLYKCKLDHSSKTKICDDIVNSINVIGDWIYYIRDKKAIYKIKSNGTNKTEILFEDFSYIYVIKDWIYCVKTQSDMFGRNSDTTVVKIKVDGSAREEMVSAQSVIYIDENYIYYKDGYREIFKMAICNRNSTVIMQTDSNINGPYIFYNNEIFFEIYFTERVFFSDLLYYRLVKVSVEDKKRINITNKTFHLDKPLKINFNNLHDQWAYYVDYQGIWKYIIGKFGEKTLHYSCRGIVVRTLHVIDNWLYFYIEEGETKKLTRVPIEVSSSL